MIAARPHGLRARLLLARRRLRWAIARAFLVTTTRLLVRIRLLATPRPPAGGYILAANHLSWIDPFVLMACLPPSRQIWFLGNQDAVLTARWKQALVGRFGSLIPVDLKARMDRAAMAEALEVLERGEVLGIFPEGGIGPGEGQLRRFKPGVGFLAQHAGCPILPVAIAGTRELWRGKEVLVRFGEPLQVPEPESSSAAIRTVTAEVEAAVQALLPPYTEPVGTRKPWPWLTRLMS